MPEAVMEKLLILQGRDQRRIEIEGQLSAIPSEITALQAKIEGENRRLDESKTKLRELEVARKEIDGAIHDAEQQILRYKGQQLQVKKNEEYQALTHEIEMTGEKISQLEEKGINLLLELDEERERMTALESSFSGIIAPLEDRIQRNRERESFLKVALGETLAELQTAREAVPADALAVYDRQSQLARMPVVAALQGKTCQGCHLRVSGEVEDIVRRGKEIATCDCCGRILYWES